MREKSGKTHKSEFHFVIFVTYIKRPNIGENDDDINKNMLELCNFLIFRPGIPLF